MSKKIRYSLLAILSLVMIFAVFGSAAAQDERRPLRQRGVLRGEISAIDGRILTLELPRRSVQIVTDEATRFHIVGQETADLTDFNVGDTVLARGRRLEDGTLRASLILLQPEGEVVLGRITAVNEDSLLVNGRDQQAITVNVNPDTIVAMIGQELTWDGDPSGHDALHEGTIIAAFGAASSDGLSLEAHTLMTQRPQRVNGRPLIGEITAVNGEEISLTLPRGQTITVITGPNTIFHIGPNNEAALDDFNSGDRIAVLGRRGEGAGALLAAHVMKRQ
ncbi:MAG: hypothetical protein H6669_08480 [Ardenticatenaceae bacterium]|nr:hypothetical protein [Ardenticatenaceae bacterium]